MLYLTEIYYISSKTKNQLYSMHVHVMHFYSCANTYKYYKVSSENECYNKTYPIYKQNGKTARRKLSLFH